MNVVKLEFKLIAPHRHIGFTLVEVLVALLVMSVSVFGSVQFFSASQKNVNSQRAFFTASFAGSGFMSSMLNHDPIANAGIYSSANINSPSPFVNCLTNTCSIAELARRDIHYLSQQLVLDLPNPRFTIEIDTVNGFAELSIFWSEVWRISRHSECAAEAQNNPDESCIHFFKSIF